MRKLFLGVLLLPAVALAQPVTVEKPVVCDRIEVVMTGLAEGDYKELPIWLGESDKSKYTLFVNEKNKTWTIVQFDEKMACILGAGDQHQMIFLGPKI